MTHGLQFRSNSDEIKHYIRECLADKQPHLRKDIIQYVQNKTGNNTYTDGQWAGSFQAIAKMSGYITPKTGVYQYIGETLKETRQASENQIELPFVRCQRILDETITKLKEEISQTDFLQKSALDLTTEEFSKLQKMRQVIKQIEDVKLQLK